MAGFTINEKAAQALKYLLGTLGTSNETPGIKYWYNELFPQTPSLSGEKVWTRIGEIPPASTIADANNAPGLEPDILEKRKIRLTVDLSSGTRAYEARETFDDRTTDMVDNWIMPQMVQSNGSPSFGYSIQLYHGDPDAGGTQITEAEYGTLGGEVGWAFSYTAGVIFCSTTNASTFKAMYDSGGLWIVGYRYIGETANDLSTLIEDLSDGPSADGYFIQEEYPIDTIGQTSFTASETPVATDDFKLYVNGQLRLHGTDYTLSGTDITWLEPNGFELDPSQDVIHGDYNEGDDTIETLPVITNGQTNFSLASTPRANAVVKFYLNGILREQGIDYSLSGTSITWNDPGGLTLLTSDNITIYYAATDHFHEEWLALQETLPVESFGQTSFNVQKNPIKDSALKLYLNGQYIDQSSYALSGSSIIWQGSTQLQTTDTLIAVYHADTSARTDGKWWIVDGAGLGDYTTIQSAIDDGKKLIWIRPGTYDEVITISQGNFHLAGHQDVIINPTSVTQGIINISSATAIQDVTIEGVTLQLSPTADIDANGINVGSTDIEALILRDLKIIGQNWSSTSTSRGVMLSGGQSDITIDNCKLENWYYAGIYINATGTDQSYDVNITGCSVENYSLCGIYLGQFLVNSNISNNVITTSNAEDADGINSKAIWIDGNCGNVRITNNTLNINLGMAIDPIQSIGVYGNEVDSGDSPYDIGIMNNDIQGFAEGIHFEAPVTNLSISSNRIFGSASSYPARIFVGIFASGTLSGRAYYINIHGNHVLECNFYGVTVRDAEVISVCNNQIIGVDTSSGVGLFVNGDTSGSWGGSSGGAKIGDNHVITWNTAIRAENYFNGSMTDNINPQGLGGSHDNTDGMNRINFTGNVSNNLTNA